MNQYEFVQEAILCIPLAVLAVVFVKTLHISWYFRAIIMIMVGWGMIAGAVNLYWEYSINFAPTDEMAMEHALKDGAPRVFGTFFGWMYGIVLYCVFELIRLIWVLTKVIVNKVGACHV
ncbi:hypothetical protein [Ketobacter alkanivorans]|uniref:hypothetical protein n=1 Tax=Ketobacter alkanivorans TaxID=1917421 RepID=UPI0013151F16|nr:hypothetical protein [Ketobacter alkanivorans]